MYQGPDGKLHSMSPDHYGSYIGAPGWHAVPEPKPQNQTETSVSVFTPFQQPASSEPAVIPTYGGSGVAQPLLHQSTKRALLLGFLCGLALTFFHSIAFIILHVKGWNRNPHGIYSLFNFWWITKGGFAFALIFSVAALLRRGKLLTAFVPVAIMYFTGLWSWRHFWQGLFRI